MINAEYVKLGLRCCAQECALCDQCPYKEVMGSIGSIPECIITLIYDANYIFNEERQETKEEITHEARD